jgi:hypothetical protein
MASTYKTFVNNDVATTKTLLHEAIPLTGTIVSGTYYIVESETQTNIKRYSHGMFESVYDYPYLSSSANHIFDLTCGYSAKSHLSSSANLDNAKKINIYNQMAQVLVGYDATGSIRRFDRDGDFTTNAEGNKGAKIDEAFFINYARLLTKDEVKKNSFRLKLYTHSAGGPGGSALKTFGDYLAGTSYKTNSPAGEYAILYTGSGTPNSDGSSGKGLIYYQAGVAVLTASVFTGKFAPNVSAGPHWSSVDACLTGSRITGSCEALRNRWDDCDFNNTTELNSTVYFCRANHNEFNYSANPTYVSSSKIRVKNQSIDEPVSYITGIGLYSPDNELLAVAKVSEPLKKAPSTELTLRVRLDY